MAEARAQSNASDHPGAEVRHLPARVERGPDGGLDPAAPRAVAAARASAVPVPIAAAGGFLVGLVTLVLARALRPSGRRRGLALGRSRRERTLEVTGSRSFLVDVHLLKR